MIRDQISSNFNDLNELNKIYYWIPNENMIRPNTMELARKKLTILTIENDWESMYDFILYKVFNQNFLLYNKKYIPFIKTDILEWVLTKSLFKYNLPSNTEHYVLWNSMIDYNTGSLKINELKKLINNLLNKEISNICNHNNYNYVWYINPKPSVPEFFHVQVFFIRD